jgi:hypothetical protein
MSDRRRRAEQYRRKSEECVALAKGATSNKLRAQHYAAAERYLKLAEAEAKLTRRTEGWLRGRFSALFQRPRSETQLAR